MNAPQSAIPTELQAVLDREVPLPTPLQALLEEAARLAHQAQGQVEKGTPEGNTQAFESLHELQAHLLEAEKRRAPLERNGSGSALGGGNREPVPTVPGTDGNRWGRMFEHLDAFLDRAEKEPDPTWLIEGFLPDRGKTFIVAEPNAGKTWFALWGAAIAARDGRDVFIVEEEGGAKKLGWRLGLLGVRGNVFVSHLKGALVDNALCRAALVARVKAATRPVVIFDPFTSLHQGNENETEHANLVQRCLSEVANANPESLIVVCHHKGKNTADRSAVYAGRGSSVFPGWADVLLNLEGIPQAEGAQRVAFTVTLAKSRDSEKGRKRDIAIDLQTGEVEVSESHTERAEEIDQAIFAQLKKAPGGLIASALVALLKRKRATVMERAKALAEEGRLVAVKSGKSITYKLPTHEEAPQ